MNESNPPKNPRKGATVAAMVEDVVGCKWSLAVLGMIRDGTHRPGLMARTLEGLTTKVLNERLRKLQRHGIIEKRIFPVSPPHVEYHLTDFGVRFLGVLNAIDALQRDLEAGPSNQPKPKRGTP